MLILLIVSFLIGIGVASVLVLAMKSRNVPPELPSQRLGIDLGLDAELINDDTSDKKPIEEETATSEEILSSEDLAVAEGEAMLDEVAVTADPATSEETTEETTLKAKTAVPEEQTETKEEGISDDAVASDEPPPPERRAISNGSTARENMTPTEKTTVSEDEAIPGKGPVPEEATATREEDLPEEATASGEMAASEQTPASNGIATEEKTLSPEETTLSEDAGPPEKTPESDEAITEKDSTPAEEITVSEDSAFAEKTFFAQGFASSKGSPIEEGSNFTPETDFPRDTTDAEDYASQIGQIRLKSRPGRGLPKPYYGSSDESETDRQEEKPLPPRKKKTPGAFFGWITKKRPRFKPKIFGSSFSEPDVPATRKRKLEGLDWGGAASENSGEDETGVGSRRASPSSDPYEDLFRRPPISGEDDPLEDGEFKKSNRLQTHGPMDQDSVGEFDDDLPAEASSLEDPSESYLEFPTHAGKKAELRALLARPRALAIQHGLPDPPLLDSWRPLGSSEHDTEMEGDTTSHGVQLPKSFSTLYKEASQTIDREGDKGEFIPPGTYYYLALLSFFAGEFEPAVAYLQLTLEADSPRARALNLLGLAYHMQGFEEEAEARLREAANTKGISPTDRGIILTNLGLVFTYRRAPDDALRHYAKALEIHRQQGDRFSQAETLSRMGRLCRAKRSLDEASRYHQEALENWQKLGDRSKVSLELRLLAAVFREKGNYKEALDLSQRALQMNRELRDHREEAINLGNIGLIYSVERDYSEALKYFRAALALHQRVGNLKGEANNLGNVGNILFLMGKSDDALQAYQSALEINQNIGYRWGEAIDLGNIGRIQIQENNMEAAGASLRDAQRIFRDLNATTQAEAIQNTLDQISAHIPSDL